MFFFVGQTMKIKVSGIENAQIKRLVLFRKFGKPAKILTMLYDPETSVRMAAHGVHADEYFNLYDYLCDIREVEQQQIQPTDILKMAKLPLSSVTEKNKRYYLKGKLTLFIDTFSNGNVKRVLHYGPDEKYTSEDKYDVRGFLSSTIIFDVNQRRLVDIYFDLAGNKRITQRWQLKDEKVSKTSVIIDDGQRKTILTGKNELQAYFLSQLAEAFPQSAFITDRALDVSWAMENTKTPIYKALFLHNIHATNLLKNPTSKDYNFNYRQPLLNLNQWDCMIAQTDQQAADCRLQFPDDKVVKISGASWDPETVTKNKLKDRQPYKMISISRISPEKRIEEQIHIFNKIHAEIPDATFDIWGLVSDDDYFDKLKQQIKELKLEKEIQFHDFALDISKVYDEAQLMIVTSEYEGVMLVINEALSHGVPVIAYDFKYAPREFIIPGENGNIVAMGDRGIAASTGIDLLQDKKKWQEYSNHAYESALRFSQKEVFAQWQQISDRAAEFYEKGGQQ